MASWQTYNFPDAVCGDTYNTIAMQITCGIDIDNQEPVDLTGAKISMWFKNSMGRKKLEFSTETDGINITDAANGEFVFELGKIEIEPGIYNHDVEIEFADGTIKTYIKGTINILEDITNH